MHNLQKPIVGTLVQGWTQNPCLAAGLKRDPVRSIWKTLFGLVSGQYQNTRDVQMATSSKSFG